MISRRSLFGIFAGAAATATPALSALLTAASPAAAEKWLEFEFTPTAMQWMDLTNCYVFKAPYGTRLKRGPLETSLYFEDP